MRKSDFRTPLIQSGVVLLVIVFIISMIPSSGDSLTVGGAIAVIVGSIFKLLLFIVAITFAVAVSIAVLIGIFLAGLAIQSPEKAAETYGDLKFKFSALVGDLIGGQVPRVSTVPESTITMEEYEQMKSEISALQSTNSRLAADLTSLKATNDQLQHDVEGLSGKVHELQAAEAQIQDLLATLSTKVEEDRDTEIKLQVAKLEELYQSTSKALGEITARLEELEQPAAAGETGGIFSYIESDEDQALFKKQVAEAVAQEMTYAQIDEFLTETLPKELDTVIKDHPSLTKDYIRSVRN